MAEEIKNEVKRMLALLKEALQIYVEEGRERILENEEYELYKMQYPFEEYYHFKEEFRIEWE
jgi:hypothetical protein